MSGERRATERCPLCQGPTKADSNMPEGIRCRMSLCDYNHQHVACPRCSSKEHSSVEATDQGYKYTCMDCLNVYEVS